MALTYNTTQYTWGAGYTLSVPTEQLDQTTSETRTHTLPFGRVASIMWISQSVTVGITGPITKISPLLKRVGTISTTYKASIYSDSSGSPGSRISDETLFDPNNIGTSDYAFFNISITNCNSISVGTVVHIVLSCPTADSSDYVIAGRNDNDVYAGGDIHYSTDGSTWVNTDMSGKDINLKTYITA